MKSENSFTRNVATLLTGNSIAQLIPIILTPILARLYSPDDFGTLGLFVAISGVLAIIATARYESAVMVVPEDNDAINLALLGLLLASCFSLILFAFGIIFNSLIATFLGDEKLGLWITLIPLIVWLTGTFNILTSLNLRKKYYKDLAKANIYKSCFGIFPQICLGVLKAGFPGLIIGNIISNFAVNLKLFHKIKQSFGFSGISFKRSFLLGKQHIDFPLHNAPPSLLNAAGVQLPLIFIPKLFGLSIAGQFFLAQRMIDLPCAIFSKPISQVFFQTMVEKNQNGETTIPFLFKTMKRLVLIIFPIIIVSYLISPYLFRFIFGEQWVQAGQIAQYLSLAILIRFIVSPLSSVFSITGFQKRGAIWKYSYFVTSSLALSFASLFSLDLKSFLFIFVVHEYSLYSIHLYLIIKSTRAMDLKLS
ncbi:oligosaccharide flippase family protein [Akkermansiaceae bacterium]|nr:oligosaccharide flippase family protein [Akkermansiaceae bacterium]